MLIDQIKSRALLLATLVCLSVFIPVANAASDAVSEYSRLPPHAITTGHKLKAKWDTFPLIQNVNAKRTEPEVLSANPLRDGSVCSDGWRRLLLNLSPSIESTGAYSGFRFKYEGNDEQSFMLIYRTPSLGKGTRNIGMIDQHGNNIDFTNSIQVNDSIYGACFHHLDSNKLVAGQEYLVWFELHFDYPVELSFRTALGKVSEVDASSDFRLMQVISENAQYHRRNRHINPLSHLGIGLTLVKQPENDRLVVISGVVPDSPADKNQLKLNMVIHAINSQPVNAMSLEEVNNIIQDENTRQVTLTVDKQIRVDGKMLLPIDVTLQKTFIDGVEIGKIIRSYDHLRLSAVMGNKSDFLPAAKSYERKQNYEQAVRWYNAAADDGSIPALLALATLYSNGKAFEVDRAKATQFYLRAAELGDTEAAVTAAKRYEAGIGVEQDVNKAFELYMRAAKDGNMNASVKVGEFYSEGKGVEQNEEIANQWLRNAAQQGHRDAAYQLGILAVRHKQYQEAEQLFLLGIKENHAGCMVELGKLYEGGLGFKQDYAEAGRWYMKAASGNASGQPQSVDARYRVGLMLRDGKGMAINPARSRQFLLQAAIAGHEGARSTLAQQGLDWQELVKQRNQERKAAEEVEQNLPFLRN